MKPEKDDWSRLHVVFHPTFQLERGSAARRWHTPLDLVFSTPWKTAREMAGAGRGRGEGAVIQMRRCVWGGACLSESTTVRSKEDGVCERALVVVSASSANGFGRSLLCVHADERETSKKEGRRFIFSSSIVPFRAQ